MENKIQELINYKTKQLELVCECLLKPTSEVLKDAYSKNEIELRAQLAVLHHLLDI